VACYNQSTGEAILNPNGGTSPYTYLWSNSSTLQNLSNISAGSYSVTVTDANGCSAAAAFTILQPDSALSFTSAVTNVLCNGQSTGAISTIPIGGTPAYSYLWNNRFTSQNLTNISAGNYSVTITDANGCSAAAAFTILQPDSALSFSSAVTNVLCNGQS